MNLKKSNIILIICISFIVGVGSASLLSGELLGLDLQIFYIVIFLFIVIIILSIFKFNKFIFIFIIILFYIIGLWRFSISQNYLNNNNIRAFNNRKTEFQGFVSDAPINNKKYQKIILNNVKIDKNISGKVLINAPKYPEYYYGDILKVKCKIQIPEKFDDFNYERYLAAHNIYALCYYPRIEKIAENKNIFKLSLINFKKRIQLIIDASLEEPQASLTKAIVLGDKQFIAEDVKYNFIKLGLSHIIAISGMHMAILVGIFSSFLFQIGLNRKKSFYIILFLIFIYITLIGAPASALRAGLMSGFMLWGLYLGRVNKIYNSLFIIAVIMLCVNPKLLRDDVGFQLSFLSVLGIIIYYPVLEKIKSKYLIERYNNKIFKTVYDIISISIIVQIVILPLIIWHFKYVSLISPIANLLIVWMLPVIFPLIIFAIILSLIFPFLKIVFFLPVMICWKYIMFVVFILNKINVLGFNIKLSNIYFVFVYYLLLISFTVFYLYNKKYDINKKND